ncbi:MAG: AAA family ATPase [Alphaproteobacteria bacterium]|nr:AAA family ATPase [Alphaproteobacteria bacterium]
MSKGRSWEENPELRARGEAERAAYAKGQRRFPLTRFKDVEVGQSRNYLVKGLIPRIGLVIVYGAPKCGKTFWVTDVMLRVALGREYRGHRVEKGAVVYIACEGERGLAGRLEAFRRRCLAPEDNQDPPFYLLPTRLDLVSEVELLAHEIAGQVGDERPVAIVVDTLNRSLRGSESNDQDMGDYIKAADRLRETFDCAVIIIHHCGIDDKRPRGHTSLAGAADAQLAVKRDSNGGISVRVEWMKDGPQGEELASKLEVVEIGIDEDGAAMTSCVVVPSADRSVKPATVALSRRQRHARELLNRTIERKGQVIAEPGDSNLMPNRIKAASIDQWRKECYLSLPVDSTGAAEQEAKRKAFMRVRKDLAANGVTKESGGWVWLVAGAPSTGTAEAGQGQPSD